MVDLGWIRQGAGLRFDLFNARRGEYVSLALAATASSKPIIVRTDPGTDHPDYDWSIGFDGAAGFDFSVPLGGVFEPLLGIACSWGD